MKKIKDNIDLKQLEKYGYRDMDNCYDKHLVFGGMLFIDKTTRKITRVHPYDIKETPSEWDVEDIQKAGFVEEVRDVKD